MEPATQHRVTICRKVSFSCGHRCYRPDLSEEENRVLYGSAYSPQGHGHNYVLEAHVDGPIDPLTGMVINLRDLDAILISVTDPLDHHFLNTDVPFFTQSVPTAENIARYCFVEISSRMKAKGICLARVRLFEGSDFWVDCAAHEGT